MQRSTLLWCSLLGSFSHITTPIGSTKKFVQFITTLLYTALSYYTLELIKSQLLGETGCSIIREWCVKFNQPKHVSSSFGFYNCHFKHSQHCLSLSLLKQEPLKHKDIFSPSQLKPLPLILIKDMLALLSTRV